MDGWGRRYGYAALLTLVAVLLLTPRVAHAQVVSMPHVSVALVADHRVLSSDRSDTITAALRFTLEADWHIYWQNPGDAGMATEVVWDLPPGFVAGPLEWQTPARIGDPPDVIYGYDHEAMLLTRIAVPAGAAAPGNVTLRARVSWLVCKQACLPGHATVNCTLPVRAGAPDVDPASPIAQRHAPRPVPVLADAARRRGDTIALGMPAALLGAAASGQTYYFFPAAAEVIDHSSPQHFEMNGGRATIRLVASSYASKPATRLTGILVRLQPDGRPVSNDPADALPIDVPIVDAGTP